MSEKTTRFLHLFAALSQTLNAPSLVFDVENHCKLSFKDGVVVNLHLDTESDELLIYSEVEDLEKIEDRKKIMLKLLNADFLWIATRGFTLSMAEDSYRIVLAGHQDLDYFPDETFLVQYIVAFAGVVRKWAELIQAETLPTVGAIMPPVYFSDDEDGKNDDLNDDDRLAYERFNMLWI